MTRAAVVLALAGTTAALAVGPTFRPRAALTVGPTFRSGAAPELKLGPTSQRRFGYGIPVTPSPPYDGQFTFVRLRYGPKLAVVSQQVPWSHDYPAGERHFMQILNELTLARPKMEATSIYGFDEAALFRFPVAYMAEPGFLRLSDEEAAAFRAYLEKGGFVIFDDFAENRGGWYAFAAEMQHVLPGARWVELDGTHPIFHAFFEIDKPLDLIPPYDQQYRPVYYGLFEDNDPRKRLMAIANYNNDISEYWEFSATGLMPIIDTNEAYKLGVNYVMYALTH